jgi:hypothetical protein
LEIHLRNSRHERASETVADTDGSFLALYRDAPKNSVLAGVQEIGDTMFNAVQCQRLEAELTGLAEERQTKCCVSLVKLARRTQAAHRQEMRNEF